MSQIWKLTSQHSKCEQCEELLHFSYSTSLLLLLLNLLYDIPLWNCKQTRMDLN